ncbi:hypothetical protein [Adhaeribacter aquaticus]|uniref:hypothetical protein n=1 Tax=Adhaeribacter aquaticus TaxID=299567 RepID=UPI000410B8C8|nr:hypothetical protein [Adhaeribacter aquaticus]
MKNCFLIIVLFFTLVFTGFSQTQPGTAGADENDEVSKTDPVEIRGSGLSIKFYQKGEKIPATLLREVVTNSPEAVREMKLGRKDYLASIGFNTVGGFIVGYSITNVIFGGDINVPVAVIGAGLIGVGIPFTKRFLKHAENAANIHNRSLSNRYFRNSEFQFGLSGTGVGLKVSF